MFKQLCKQHFPFNSGDGRVNQTRGKPNRELEAKNIQATENEQPYNELKRKRKSRQKKITGSRI